VIPGRSVAAATYGPAWIRLAILDGGKNGLAVVGW